MTVEGPPVNRGTRLDEVYANGNFGVFAGSMQGY